MLEEAAWVKKNCVPSGGKQAYAIDPVMTDVWSCCYTAQGGSRRSRGQRRIYQQVAEGNGAIRPEDPRGGEVVCGSPMVDADRVEGEVHDRRLYDFVQRPGKSDEPLLNWSDLSSLHVFMWLHMHVI